jgi:hypothetical protein
MASFTLSRVSTRSRLFLGLSAALALAACSSDEEGPKPDNALRTEQGFCQEWAKRACNSRVVSACSSTKEGCLDRQSNYCEGLIPSGYSSVNAEDCLEAVESAYANAQLSAEDIDVVVKLGGACSHLIKGPRSEDESCTDRYQCDTVHGFECVIKPGQESGTCVLPHVVAGGFECAAADTSCEVGFYCRVIEDDGENVSICAGARDEGQSCSADEMCGDAAFCEKQSGETEGVCTEKLADREECVRDEECLSGYCLLDLATPQCVSSITLTIQASACNDL